MSGPGACNDIFTFAVIALCIVICQFVTHEVRGTCAG